ncbi:MAG: substrate-binding domain-containing protein [Magnetococcus sp. WYHC-3]
MFAILQVRCRGGHRSSMAWRWPLLLLMGLWGMGSVPTALQAEESAAAQQTEKADSAAPVLIGFPQDTMANDWRAAQVQEVATALSRHAGVRFAFTDAQGEAARQAVDLERLVEQGAKVIITSPRDCGLMTPVVNAAHARGIPVVLLTRRILNEGYTTFIGADDREIGVQAAHAIADALGGQGRVVMLRGVEGTTTAAQRSAGFLDTLARHHPRVQVVADVVANYLRHDAILAMERILREGTAIDALFAQSDSMAVGARIALKAAGRDPKDLVIVGIDFIPEAREALLAGEQTATFTYPTAGLQGAEVALRLLRGETVPREIRVPFVKVTRANAASVPTVFETPWALGVNRP